LKHFSANFLLFVVFIFTNKGILFLSIKTKRQLLDTSLISVIRIDLTQ